VTLVEQHEGGIAMLKEFIHDDLVFLDKDHKNFETVLSAISQTLVRKQYADHGFAEALLTRERQYPTGLKFHNHSIGIPHGGSEFVKKEFISVVTLQHPISMNRMDNPSESLDIDTLFILGLRQADTHLQVLQELIGLLQDENFIESVKTGMSIKSLLCSRSR
jgi:PTS system galactitol-specific IIA component